MSIHLNNMIVTVLTDVLRDSKRRRDAAVDAAGQPISCDIEAAPVCYCVDLRPSRDAI